MAKIKTLTELRDYINEHDEWMLEANDVIAENGWHDETGEDYGICFDGVDRLQFNSDMEAVIVHVERERLGEELRAIRNKKGLTIYELGDMCGMTPTTISKIENGKYNVSVDILGKVADALGCKLTFEPKEITLQWLADRLNSVDDWPLWANAVIERMGWIDETGNDYGICSDGEYRLSYDDNMVAVVNRIE